MILSLLQKTVELLYAVVLPHRVSEFLISEKSCRRWQRCAHQISHSCATQESLFIREDEREVAVGLYIDPCLIARVEKGRPFVSLTEARLSDFCIALEGVSHFVYFLWRAGQGHPVTALELELQAEVDKFLVTTLLRKQQRGCWQTIFHRLFEAVDYPLELSTADRHRYQTANRLAAKFCAHLQERYLSPARPRELLPLVRTFWRRNHWEKLRYLTP